MFNAGLAYSDEQSTFHPELAQALPQLNTDTWRVFPDGQMETTYKLKPNLTWHDGTPLTAEDFVFAFQVYAGPELGQARGQPQRNMQEVLAPDARTVVIRWRQPYPAADSLALAAGSFGSAFPPLPRHILAEPLHRGNPDAFAAHPYWSSEYVGLGAFRLQNWERGAFLEASAFDGYVFGRPKIDRIRILFHTNPNTIMANLLAGEADMTAENALRFEQGVILRRDWEGRGAGVVQFFPSGGRRMDIQFDPAHVNPQALLDLRVRQALALAVDKEALNQGLMDGLSQPADTWVFPQVDYFPEVQRAITKYPHDLQRAAQRLADAGFVKGADGFYASPTGGRLAMELMYEANPQYDKESAIIADGLKRFGIEMSTSPLTEAQKSDPAWKVDFSALRNQGGGSLENIYGTSQIPTPQNRYAGNNRGAWVNAEYDRLQEAFTTTLDRVQRNGHLVQMAKIVSEEVAAIPLYYNLGTAAYVPGLQGVIPGDVVGSYWNMHLWELR
jgi:peptide/nickel transport system substrate-binding protein